MSWPTYFDLLARFSARPLGSAISNSAFDIKDS